MFANIIVDITHEKLDKIFQYKSPLPDGRGTFYWYGSVGSLWEGKQNDKGICDGILRTLRI